MEIEVKAAGGLITILPESELDEIAQNIRTIVTTHKGDVPFDRGFGIPREILDLPISIAQTKITAEIVQAVSKFEPRVKIKKVNFSGDPVDGTLIISVSVDLVERKLRGGIGL